MISPEAPTTSPSPPRPTTGSLRINHSQDVINAFPLPIELKHQIFSYLLHSDKVHRAPICRHQDPAEHLYCAGIGSTYDFGLGLLGVNSTFAHEAKCYLYKYNAFIKVKYNTWGLAKMLYEMGVPIIADKNLDHFDQHSLTISLTGTISPWAMHDSLRDSARQDAGSLLLLAQDLPKLCEMLRFCASHLTPRVPFLVGSHCYLPRSSATVCRSLTVMVEVRDIEYQTVSAAEKRTYLQTLQRMVGLGYDMSLTGFDDVDTLAQQTKHLLAPPLIWLHAREWDRVEALQYFKRQADALALSGDVCAATQRYNVLATWFRTWGCIKMTFKDLGVSSNPALAEVHLHHHTLMLDVMSSIALLNLRNGQILHPRGDPGIHLLSAQGLSQDLRVRLWHLDTLASVHEMMKNGHKEADMKQRIKRFVSHVAQVEGDLDQYTKHDLDRMRKALATYKATKSLELEMSELSPQALPPRTFDTFGSREKSKYPGRPEGLVGWQDLAAYQTLSWAQKAHINRMQRKAGGVVSEL